MRYLAEYLGLKTHEQCEAEWQAGVAKWKARDQSSEPLDPKDEWRQRYAEKPKVIDEPANKTA